MDTRCCVFWIAILIIGPRASGKTTTAERFARSIVRLDRPAEDAAHLVWLRDRLGERFLGGALLHTGPRYFELEERIVAAPIGAVWA